MEMKLKLLITYRIIEIIDESSIFVNFTTKELYKKVKLKLHPPFLGRPMIMNKKVNIKDWNIAKRTGFIEL